MDILLAEKFKTLSKCPRSILRLWVFSLPILVPDDHSALGYNSSPVVFDKLAFGKGGMCNSTFGTVHVLSDEVGLNQHSVINRVERRARTRVPWVNTAFIILLFPNQEIVHLYANWMVNKRLKLFFILILFGFKKMPTAAENQPLFLFLSKHNKYDAFLVIFGKN